MARNYWMVVTSLENFEISRRMGFTAHGLKAYHRRKVQRMEPGDRLLYYIAGRRSFAATATITSQYFEDRSSTWKRVGIGEWILRVRTKPEFVLDEDDFMDARQLAPRLDYIRRWNPESWYIAFAQSNLHLLPKRDFTLVEEEMRKIIAKKPRVPRQHVVPVEPQSKTEVHAEIHPTLGESEEHPVESRS